ncbi:MAG: AAA family ATPase [Oscillospiraceae bacterium]|nr:AAA family ATPase [Oscillospiraceae bacterium]
MKRFSILYSGETVKENINFTKDGYDFGNILADLNIREISKFTNLEPKETEYVLNIIKDFSSGKEDIILRNGILTDFLTLPKFYDVFADQIEYFGMIREKLTLAKRNMLKATGDVSAETSLLNYNKIVQACFFTTLTYQTVFNLYREFKYFEVTSPRLVEFKEFLIELMEKSSFKQLCDECKIFSDHLNEGLIFDIEMKLNSILRIVSLKLFDFRYIKPPQTGLFHAVMRAFAIEEKKFENKKIYVEKTFLQESKISSADDAYLKSVLEFQINLAARRLAAVYETLIDVFMNISQELVFYKYALSMINHMKINGMPYCLAEVSDEPGVCEFDNLCDMTLAFAFKESGAAVVKNDFKSEKNINIIIGANQSGKTTFLRAFGAALVFARAGLPTPAKSAKIDAFENLYTHFQRYDAELKNEGQLDTELAEMAKIVYSASSKSVVLMNESFSSTGIKDALQVAGDVLGAFAHIKSRVIYVTHIPEMREKLISSGRVKDAELYKTGQDKEGNPTFKLEKV